MCILNVTDQSRRRDFISQSVIASILLDDDGGNKGHAACDGYSHDIKVVKATVRMVVVNSRSNMERQQRRQQQKQQE